MRLFKLVRGVVVVFLFSNIFAASLAAQNYCNSTPVAIHGDLSVNGSKIVDQNNDRVSFAGNSLFWSNTGWGGEKYYNANVVNWLQQDWNSTIVRAAMGVEANGGYIGDPNGNKNRTKAVVDAAIANGMYVIIDWHSHHAEQHQAAAVSFFEEMAQTYGNYPNVIYEIYNEPLQISWSSTIKPYAEAVISAIRAYDPDNLIIVGTPTWSQDVDVASNDPITSYNNIAYTLHFYAGTHHASLRQKAETALNNGIALMVTEWGTVNANGDGAVAYNSTDEWMTFLAANDISHLNWATNDKSEGASALKPGTSQNGGWSSNDLTPSGTKTKDIIENWNQYCSGGNSNSSPTVSITSPSFNSSADEGTTITITADASDSDGNIVSVEFFVNGVSIGSDNTAPYSINWTPSAGSYVLTVVATDDMGSSTTSSFIPVTINTIGGNNTPAYPNGDPHDIPGTINTTHYDTGGPGVSYYDTTSGNTGNGIRSNEDVDTEFIALNGNVGYIDAGEWLDFTVDVQITGDYDITYSVATEQSGQFRLEFGGQNVTGTVNVPNTGGWSNFTDIVSQNISLNSGQQVMRLYFIHGPFNISDIVFELDNGVVPVTGVNVNPSTITMDEGDTETILATVVPGNATNTNVTWSSSDPSIATVDNSGVVTGILAGTVVITATTVDGGYTASTNVTVNAVVSVTGVNVNPSTLTIDEGDTETILATVVPGNATNTNVTWSSSDPSIATVDNSGVVTGILAGTVVITATTVDGGYTASTNVTVNAVNNGNSCGSPIPINLPFSYDGSGTFCWEISGSIDYINSWNTTSVTINGVDYTNAWSNSMPAPINGKYYVEYVASVPWSHFEVFGTNSGGGPPTCNNPVPINIPFFHNGSGTFCWEISGSIQFVNSWNTTSVTINGVDYTNTWSNSMPAPINGKYYVEYSANVPWSHFRAIGVNSLGVNPNTGGKKLDISDVTSTSDNIGNDSNNEFISNRSFLDLNFNIYPNPSNGQFQIKNRIFDGNVSVKIYTTTGDLVHEQMGESHGEDIRVNTNLNSGVYFVVTSDGVESITKKVFFK